MMRCMWAALALGGLVACHAEVRAPASAPRLAPEMQRLGFYVGTWSCRGVATGEDGSRQVYDALRVTVVPVLDGSWLEVRVFDGGVPATSELKGYDREGHRFRHIWAAGEGSSGSSSSPGWEGDHMVFTEDHPANGHRGRAVFTKLGETRYSHRAEVDTGHGYRVEFEKSCAKRTSS